MAVVELPTLHVSTERRRSSQPGRGGSWALKAESVATSCRPTSAQSMVSDVSVAVTLAPALGARALAQAQETKTVPWVFLVGCIVNYLVDGFLVGIGYVASPQTGLVLALATAVENGVLGFMVSLSLFPILGIPKTMGVMFIGALCMVLMAAIGAGIAGVTKDIIYIYIGFIAFGMVGLMFLVIEELVHQAKALAGGNRIWWVSIWMYIGFLLVILSERVL
uniref:Uncharacterized protein n=1 Tax=Eutreptiella gymnastica TaxID=73025 RepID=A0A7S1N6U5_9EUGL